MADLNRRAALGTAALASLAVAMPVWATDSANNDATGVGWDLDDIYPDDAAWDAARQRALATIPKLANAKGTLGNSAEALADALIAQSDLGRTIARIYTFASLKADADLRIALNQERQAQAIDLYTRYGEAIAWVAPEILGLGKNKIDQFIAADPTVKNRFDFYLASILREAPHTLSPEGEALLAGTTAPFAGPSNIREQLVASDIPWPTITLSDGQEVRLDDQQYTLHRDAANRADRKAVMDSFFGEYGKFQSSLGAAYLAHVKGDVYEARARHYPTSLAASLAANNIPESVYRTLVAETNKGLGELHRYFDVRRRMLKLPDIAYYDIYPPLVELDKPENLADMRATVLKAVAPLGKDYVALLAKSTAAQWMDPFPRPGKKSGAYMSPGAYDVHPYLLLNLKKDYSGMTTFAHEWGHAMHTLLANQAQPYEKADYPLFLAEIPSTCNEQLLVAYMVDQARSREEKIYYLGQQLEQIRGTFYRQAMFAEFELEAHDKAEAGEGLSGEAFTGIYGDLLTRYSGDKMAVSPTYFSEWAYIPHFYSSFYVYQYATCISAASYFARSILTGGVKERDTYLNVLKAGGSDYPVDILKRAGLDMTSPAPYQAVISVFRDTLDQIETLMA